MGGGEARVRVETENGVAHVRLNRPDKMNALDPPMFDALIAAGEDLARLSGLRAVVLSGEGRSFCAGLDMESFAAMSREGSARLGDLTERTHGDANRFQHVALVWRRLPVPVVAALHGAVFGGGLQIALGADLRYVAPDARLCIMEIKWGLVPDMGGVALLRHLMRADRIRELTYTGRIVSGEQAYDLGLATAVHADPLAAALATAREIAGRSPDAVRAGKRLLNFAEEERDGDILLAESHEQKALIGSANQLEAVRANVGRREPVFVDAAPAGEGPA